MYKKWRQLCAILLMIAIIASFTACGGSTTEGQKDANSPSTSGQQRPQSNDEDGSFAGMGDEEQEPEIIQEAIEDKAKKAMETLEIWDGRVAESFGGGSGSEEDPYRITNAKQLAKLAHDTNSGVDFSGVYFILTTDILLNDISQWDFNSKKDQASIENWRSWIPIGMPYNGIRFTGTFDGDEHTIWGLHSIEIYSESGSRGGFGLFGSVRGTVSNVTVACAFLAPKAEYVGTVVGELEKGSISNCHVEQAILSPSVSSKIGGICGGFVYNSGLSVTDCSMNGSITYIKEGDEAKKLCIGGIIGDSYGYGKGTNCFVLNCYSSCDISLFTDVKVTDPKDEYVATINVGGISGYALDIENCYSVGSISAECNAEIVEGSKKNVDVYIGGVAGSCNYGSIANCGARGEINRSGNNMSNYAGGIVGYINGNSDRDKTVDISFSYSNIKCADDDYSFGGIAQKAERRGISITNCYYCENQYGSFGISSPPTGVFMNLVDSLSENEMKKAENYIDWDFEFSWVQDDNINDGLPIPATISYAYMK